MRHLLLIVAAVLVLTGCNTMFQKTYQKIVVYTQGVENVLCTLTTAKNKYVVLPPRSVLVERSPLPMTVTCEKAGYYPGVTTVQSEVQMAPSALNLFNGAVPGTAYDVASNSIYDYPDTISVNMQPDPNIVPLEQTERHVLQKKPEEVKVKPVTDPPKEADKALSKSLRK